MQFTTAIHKSHAGRIGRHTAAAAGRPSTRSTVALWTIQGALAALFLFAGVMKFAMPIEEMTQESGLPAWFLRFIGVAEILGAVGLVLPCLLRVRPALTPLAAAGLVVIMAGATILTAAEGDVVPAVFPLLIGAGCAFVALRRARRLTVSRPMSATVSPLQAAR